MIETPNLTKQIVTTESQNLTKPTLTTEAQNASTLVAANQNANVKEQKTFKDELSAVKNENGVQVSAEKVNIPKDEKVKNTNNPQSNNVLKAADKKIVNQDDTAEKNTENVNTTVALVGNINKNQTDSIKDSTKKNSDKITDKDAKPVASTLINPVLVQPLNELKSEIENIKEIKSTSSKPFINGKISLTESIDSKNEATTIKMDANDALFFANLIKKEEFSVTDNKGTAEIKSEATQQSTQVSAVLMSSISEAFQSNKPIRIDFGNDIAVIMKIDKNGKLSAEFIPGDKAVENYLKANVPLLQQSFDRQELPYESLSYRKHQDQREQQQNNNKNKENDDE